MENNEVYFHQTDKMREEFAELKKKYIGKDTNVTTKESEKDK